MGIRSRKNKKRIKNGKSADNKNEKDENSETIVEIQNFVEKHPIEYEWTFWFLERNRKKDWKDMQKEVYSFQTIEDYWCLHKHLKLPSEIRQGCDYSLFKKGIQPMWEDEANINGGRWILILRNKKRRKILDALWLEVILYIIGKNFKYSDQICGAVACKRRRYDSICIWTTNANDEKAVMEIGVKIKCVLKCNPQKLNLMYQVHKNYIDQNEERISYFI